MGEHVVSWGLEDSHARRSLPRKKTHNPVMTEKLSNQSPIVDSMAAKRKREELLQLKQLKL